HYTIKRRKEGLDLARSPVQFFWDQQTIWSVVLAKREIHNVSVLFPFSEAAPKIALDTGRSLVPFLGGFGEQFHHDRRDTRRHSVDSFVRRRRTPCDVAMHPSKGVGSCERQFTGQHLVKRYAEGIEVAARVDRAIHSPRLFRRHVG